MALCSGTRCPGGRIFAAVLAVLAGLLAPGFPAGGAEAGGGGEKLAATPAGDAGKGDLIRIFDPADERRAESDRPRVAAEVKKTSPLSMLARTGFWLGLVVLLMCGLVAAGKKLLPRSMGMFKSPAMELVGRSYLDPKRCVYLLKVGGRMLVIGSAENGLRCLSEITEQAEVEHLAALSRNGQRAAESGGKRGGFAAALKRRLVCPETATGRWSARAAGAVGGDAGGDVEVDAQATGLRELKERVEGLKARLRTIS